MKTYVITLALGVGVGIIYGFFQVRSPAPPVIALVGLLGILLGEQIPALVRQVIEREPSHVSWFSHQVKPHVFGQLPCAKPGTGVNVHES